MRGKFIVIEGPDGVGKTTQSKLLCQFLNDRGIKYLYTREPGGTDIGNKVRELLLNPASKVSNMAECLLYASARAQLVNEVIKPALDEGIWVVADRYLHSSIVYQGVGLDLGIDIVENINNIATEGLLPDFCFLIDLDTQVSLARIVGSRDRIESRGQNYFNKVRDGYLNLVEKYNMVKIDGNKSIEQINNEIIADIFKKNGRGNDEISNCSDSR